VESVIRKTVLLKKPEKEAAIRKCLETNQGELSRQLQSSRLATTEQDDQVWVADYPLLPTRRRFWEKVLRNTDHSGTMAQLRSQLKIVFEAARQTADLPMGNVVSGDFIYDQISTDLLNSGQLEREYDEVIRKQRDGTPQGNLRFTLCALIFLIGKLPRTPGADDNVRATMETLVDLAICDLKLDRPKLEQEIPLLLKKLVDAGQIMAVESEYRLQTREGSVWTNDFNRRRTATLNDDQRINSKRSELVRDGLKKALKPVSLQQGTSQQQRKLQFELSSARPQSTQDEVTFWVRDGWSDDEKSVLNDARAAGVNSPLLFGYVERMHHEELRQAIASQMAAQETLDAQGAADNPEAIEARKAIETHREVANLRINKLLSQIVSSAKVFLGGGQEASGIEVADKVQDAAASALERLFPQFSEADHANWGQVVARARAGDVGALAQVSYQGDVTKHPVCRRLLDIIGAGKKGKEIREAFSSAPFGWPKDAVDGALFVMVVAGNLRASINNQPVQVHALPQNQVGVASFYVDVPPLNVQQRLDLKALFQKAGVTTQNGKESEAASEFLQKLLSLAQSAGGDSPRPVAPETQDVLALQRLSGNAQSLQIHAQKDALAANLAAWKKSADAIAKRVPAWERLQEFQAFGDGLPEAVACAQSTAAMVTGCTLLADPDPVPELTKQLTTALRTALGTLQANLAAAFTTGRAHLEASQVWGRLSDEQRTMLTATHQLTAPTKELTGTDDEIIAALRSNSLQDRRNWLDAVPQRFARALDEASRLLEPKAVRVILPGATLKDVAELDKWLADARKRVTEKLKDGPVIL
jgi:hypothetical protein